MPSKKLTLLRHAKAVPALPGIDDHARPLNGRGRRAAAQVGIETAGARPDLVLCSSAVRTRETWEIASRAWEALPPVLIEDGLYLAEPQALLARLRGLSSTIGHVWVVGHNPGLHDLAAELAQGVAAVPDFPTAARARVEFAAEDWSALGTARALRVDVFTPARD